MSHVAKIELEINDLDDLKRACNRLGFEFMENQRTYKWFGQWVGDYPLPEGIKKEDLGKCDHAIRVPEAKYEVGIVRRNGTYLLLWDFWSSGGLEEKLGKDAGLLKQAYAIERIKRESRRKRYRIREQRTDHGVRLTLTV